jgi:hypothetical protein
MSEGVAIISALTALFAVLISPLVSLRNTDKQAKVSVLSANRQKWIDSLRDLLAEFSTAVRVVGFEKTAPEKKERIERLMFLEYKIKLMINPKEDDHRRLVDVVVQARKLCSSVYGGATSPVEDSTAEDINVALRSITEIGQTILKREWDRVKNFE